MAITINGTANTVAGLAVGGLPDGSTDADALASNAVTNVKVADDAIGVAELSATGTASSTTFLRGDNAWAAAGNVKATIATEAGALSGATNYDFTLPANCFRVDFVGQEISTSGSGSPAFRLGTSAGILSSSNYDWTQDFASHEYESDENEIHAFDPNLNASGDTGDLYVTFLQASAADKWVYRGVGNRRTQTENMYFIGFPDLGGNALTTIRFYPNGTGFDTGRFSWTAYSTV